MIARAAGKVLCAALFCAFALPASAAPVANPAALDAFVQDLRERRGFSPGIVRGILDEARLVDRALKLTDPNNAPSKTVYWREYRRRNIAPKMVAEGVQFHRRNRGALKRAEREFGVPPEIIVAILGVETRYGRVLGGFRVLDALATLGFNHPTRGQFFLGELEALLVLADRGEINPLELEGSYAGAFGISQFLPSSFDSYAVDFNDDSLRDLFFVDDAIGSVANFLVAHGWERDAPIAYPATVQGDLAIKPGVTPEHTLDALAGGGLEIDFEGAEPYGGPFAVVDLENLLDIEYRVGTVNYYALTRYNRSNKYAMAVFDLGSEIRSRLSDE